MTDRILDISDRPARLTARGGLLVIDFGKPWGASSRSDPPSFGSEESTRTARDPESGLRARDTESHTIPFADIAVLVTSHPQISFTQAVLAGLAAAGGMFIVSNEKHLPAAMMLPLSTHSTQTERFARQAAVSLPTRKRAWQQIVQAKLHAQARLLEEVTGKDWGVGLMAGKVRSGDPDNLEAQAARIYWQALFGEAGAGAPGEAFRRDPEGEGLNLHLNYGYAVLRAIVARALCTSGLHPSLGVHHHNRYDTFCLADDLMEPFRPLVDRVVARIRLTSASSNAQSQNEPPAVAPARTGTQGPTVQLDQNSKKLILEGLLVRYSGEGESRTLFDWASRSASSLVALIEERDEKLSFPELVPAPCNP
ncbi:MAG: type II CRISPR-associated endonuclease Cas1 [Terriglobia bacterium]